MESKLKKKKTNRLMLFKDTIAVYCEDQTQSVGRMRSSELFPF
jgi:hypothetical protein